MSLVTAHPLDLRKWCWTKERKNPHLLVIRRLYGVFTNKLVKKQSIRGRTPVEPHLFLFFQRHCSLLITQCPCVSTSKKKQHVPAIFVPSGLASQGHSHRMWFPGHSGCCTAPRWTYFLSGSIILWENLLLRLLRACCNALQARATWWTMIKFDNTCFFFFKTYKRDNNLWHILNTTNLKEAAGKPNVSNTFHSKLPRILHFPGKIKVSTVNYLRCRFNPRLWCWSWDWVGSPGGCFWWYLCSISGICMDDTVLVKIDTL